MAAAILCPLICPIPVITASSSPDVSAAFLSYINKQSVGKLYRNVLQIAIHCDIISLKGWCLLWRKVQMYQSE